MRYIAVVLSVDLVDEQSGTPSRDLAFVVDTEATTVNSLYEGRVIARCSIAMARIIAAALNP